MGFRRAALGATLVFVLCAVALSAKGETVRLTVVGPGLSAPIDVIDPAALASVWAGRFIGRAATEPDKSLPRYVVTFVVQPPRQQQARPMYVVMFARDRESGRGFVYLPGPGQNGYRMNVSTILREGQDGHWHEASPDWSDALAQRISERRVH